MEERWISKDDVTTVMRRMKSGETGVTVYIPVDM